MPLRGLETSPQNAEKPALLPTRGTDSGTLPAANTVEDLAAALSGLSADDRARLAALLLGQEQGEGPMR